MSVERKLLRRPWVVPSIAFAGWLVGLAPALAQGSQGYYGPHMWGGWDGGWGMFIGPIWLILFVAILVGAAVLVVRGFSGTGGSAAGGPAAPNAPLDILRERFARGEIDKEEFEERKRILSA